MSRRAVALNAAMLAALAAMAIGFLWLMSSLPRIEGRVPLHGMELPATVSRDGNGIPHITARSVHDAYFALGWVHAQDRIWQMELQRRVAAGRLAEIVGPAGLANDRFMRTLGLRALAETGLGRLDKPTRDTLDAYAAGINAWLAEHQHRLPLEFQVLRVRPEPWSPADTLAWGRLMALQLAGNWHDDLLRAGLAERMDAGRLAELFPGYPAGAPVSVARISHTGTNSTEANLATGQAAGAGKAGRLAKPDNAACGQIRPAPSGSRFGGGLPASRPLPRQPAPSASPTSIWFACGARGAAGRDLALRHPETRSNRCQCEKSGLTAAGASAVLAALPPAAEPRLASNVWVVAGRFTASGKPLLANDPHLAFHEPILWYLAGVDAPGLSVAGATVPGAPFVLAGHNQHIAWGVTSTGADTVDLFVEKLTADGTGVMTPAGPRPFATRHERIKVKGAADVDLTVRETADGPVVSDLIAPGWAKPDEVLALRTTALEPDDATAQAMHRLQRASDWRGFLAALKEFDAPVQNFAYADIAGNIGFATAGRVPVRRSGDGSLPMPGWTGEGEWTGWVPFDQLPQTYNPKSGVVVNANNAVAAPGKGPLLTASWPEGYRAQRIADLLAGRSGLKAEDMAAMQMDTLSLADLQIKGLLSGVHPASKLAGEAARMVAAWDGRADSGRAEPLIFNAWLAQLWHDLLAAPLAGQFEAYGPPRPYVLAGILTRNRHWCAEAAADHPSCEDLAARSLETAVAALAARHGDDPHTWTWGSEHRAEFANPVLAPALGWMPGLSRLVRLTAATGGDDFTVNRGSYRPGDLGAFTHIHGAGLRAVYDLADLSASRFVIATGQSGNLLSRNYDDLLPDWLANRGHPIADPSNEGAVLSLEPGY